MRNGTYAEPILGQPCRSSQPTVVMLPASPKAVHLRYAPRQPGGVPTLVDVKHCLRHDQLARLEGELRVRRDELASRLAAAPAEGIEFQFHEALSDVPERWRLSSPNPGERCPTLELRGELPPARPAAVPAPAWPTALAMALPSVLTELRQAGEWDGDAPELRALGHACDSLRAECGGDPRRLLRTLLEAHAVLLALRAAPQDPSIAEFHLLATRPLAPEPAESGWRELVARWRRAMWG